MDTWTAERMYQRTTHIYYNWWNVYKNGKFVDQLKAFDKSMAIANVKEKEEKRRK